MKNVDPLAEAFLASWNQFLNDLVKAAKLRVTDGRTYKAYEERLIPLLEKIVADLHDDQSSLLKAIHTELTEHEAPWPELSYMRREFEFFNQLLVEVTRDQGNKGNARDGAIDTAIEAARIIMGSFEEIVKNLPEKWRMVLKVLNEILKLLKKSA